MVYQVMTSTEYSGDPLVLAEIDFSKLPVLEDICPFRCWTEGPYRVDHFAQPMDKEANIRTKDFTMTAKILEKGSVIIIEYRGNYLVFPLAVKRIINFYKGLPRFWIEDSEALWDNRSDRQILNEIIIRLERLERRLN